jgi:hypothetical protein
VKVTVCRSAGWIEGIVCRRTSGFPFESIIGLPPTSIVRVTGTVTSWKSPEFSTVATIERSAETVTFVAVDVDRAAALEAFDDHATETSPSPCLPLGVPPTEAGCRRPNSRLNERALTRSVFVTKCDSGMTTPVMPSVTSCWLAGSL